MTILLDPKLSSYPRQKLMGRLHLQKHFRNFEKKEYTLQYEPKPSANVFLTLLFAYGESPGLISLLTT